MVNLTFKMDFGQGFVTVPPPRNWKEMRVQLIFTQGEMEAQLQSIVFEWVNKNADRIKQYINSGLTGGTGIFEGIGLRIYAGSNNTMIFDGCLDLANTSLEIETGIIKSPIKESGRIDWLNDVAQSITFEYLTDSIHNGKPYQITTADYKQVPYCISTIPNYTQAMLLSISLFIVVKEAVDVICKIESLIARMIGQGLSWIQLIFTIIEVVLYIIYLIAIIIAAAKLMQELMDNIIQPKKTKLGMREVDLWVKGCKYFGLNFASTIYGYNAPDGYQGRYADMTLIPKKILKFNGDPSLENYLRPPDETNATDSYGYYEGTFKQFIDDMKLVYNGDVVIRNGTLYFEEAHHWNKVDPFVLPNEGEVGYTFNYPAPYSTNASEIPAVYIVQFAKDEQDLNTYNDYTGTYCIAQTTPNVVRNQKNQLLAGSVNIQLPFAQARRKMGMTKMEKRLLGILRDFNRYINDVFRLHNKINDWLNNEAPGGFSDAYGEISQGDLVAFFTGSYWISSAQIYFGGNLPNMPLYNFGFNDDRVGWMLLSSDFIGVPKRFAGVTNGSDWYIHPNNQAVSISSILQSTVPVTTQINGYFTGVAIGVIGVNTFNGQVTNGIIHGSGFATGLGPASGTIIGTIAGYQGTYVGTVSGVKTGGTFNGTGQITSIQTTTTTVLNTSDWGSAESLMNDFHIQNLISNNQYLLFKNKTFKLGLKDFNRISNNNVFKAPNGKWGKFDRLIWDIYNDRAIDADYRIKEKYTNNYSIKISTDGG